MISRTNLFKSTWEFHITIYQVFHLYRWTHLITQHVATSAQSSERDRKSLVYSHPSSRTRDRLLDGVFLPTSILATISGRAIRQNQRIYKTSGRKCTDQFDYTVRPILGTTPSGTGPRQTFPHHTVHHYSQRWTGAKEGSQLPKNRRRGLVLTQILWRSHTQIEPSTDRRNKEWKDPSRSEDSTGYSEPLKTRFTRHNFCGSADSQTTQWSWEGKRKGATALHLGNALLTLGLNDLIVVKHKEFVRSNNLQVRFVNHMRTQTQFTCTHWTWYVDILVASLLKYLWPTHPCPHNTHALFPHPPLSFSTTVALPIFYFFSGVSSYPDLITKSYTDWTIHGS